MKDTGKTIKMARFGKYFIFKRLKGLCLLWPEKGDHFYDFNNHHQACDVLLQPNQNGIQFFSSPTGVRT